jgi:hypothetical protein
MGCGNVFFGDQAPGSSDGEGEGSSSSQVSQQNRAGSGSPGQKQNAGAGGRSGPGAETMEGTEPEAKEFVSLEFEIMDDEGLPRKGAVVSLLDGGDIVATKTVPASGIVVFADLNDGGEYTVQVDDDPEGFHV